MPLLFVSCEDERARGDAENDMPLKEPRALLYTQSQDYGEPVVETTLNFGTLTDARQAVDGFPAGAEGFTQIGFHVFG